MPLVSSQDYGRDESSAKVTLSAVFSIWHSCLLFDRQEQRNARLQIIEIFYTKTRFYKNLRL